MTHEVLPDSLASLSRDTFQNYFHSIPMSGIGLFEDLHYSVRELKLRLGDTVILLSDGAYSRLNIEELKYMIEKFRDEEGKLLKEIFAMSNERGNLDNQSGLILQF
jgi:serine/threonine protein phosphatase PrpC